LSLQSARCKAENYRLCSILKCLKSGAIFRSIKE